MLLSLIAGIKGFSLSCLLPMLVSGLVFLSCHVEDPVCIPSDGVCEPVVTALLLKKSTPPVTYKRIFLSPTNVGNFGGISAVDTFCAANIPSGLSGTFKGLVMGSTRNQTTDWVLAANTEYHREDGATIGTTNSSSIFTFPLTNPISTSATSAFTGITVVDATSWTFTGVANNCSDWGPGGTASVGSTDHTADTAVSNGVAVCATARPVYCVQQ